MIDTIKEWIVKGILEMFKKDKDEFNNLQKMFDEDKVTSDEYLEEWK